MSVESRVGALEAHAWRSDAALGRVDERLEHVMSALGELSGGLRAVQFDARVLIDAQKQTGTRLEGVERRLVRVESVLSAIAAHLGVGEEDADAP